MVFMKTFNILKIFFVAAMVFVLSACQSSAAATNAAAPAGMGTAVKVDGGSYMDLSVTELKGLLDQKAFTFVNVHIPFEGNLPKTDLSLPYDTIGQNLDKLPGDKNAKIVLYCRSGRMSTIAATELVKLGYTNIWNLAGGMDAWAQAGQPIEK